MKNSVFELITNLVLEYPCLKNVEQDIINAFELMSECYRNSGKLLICGNGGSASDADHIVGELMKQFVKPRTLTADQKKLFASEPSIASSLQRGIPAISLCAHTALYTAFSNDEQPDMAFAQQVFGYLKKNDLLLALSTSGNSKNVVNAAKTAKLMGGRVIAMTGQVESELSKRCDVTIQVPETETYKVQQLHLPVYHTLCRMLEEEFF